MNKIFYLLAALTLFSCNPQKHVQSSAAAWQKPKPDTLSINERVDGSISWKKDTATNYGFASASLNDGDLSLQFSCDNCIEELDSIYQQYFRLLEENSTPKIVYKIKNSFNDNTKLTNSIQIRDSEIKELKLENLALKGKIKELNDSSQKAKGNIGDNSPNKSGNTTNKSRAPVIAWLAVFLAGAITGRALPMIVKTIRSKFFI